MVDNYWWKEELQWSVARCMVFDHLQSAFGATRRASESKPTIVGSERLAKKIDSTRASNDQG